MLPSMTWMLLMLGRYHSFPAWLRYCLISAGLQPIRINSYNKVKGSLSVCLFVPKDLANC